MGDIVLEMFRDAGALLEGHFLLSSNRHSNSYLEKALVLQNPEYVSLMCKELANRFTDEEPDVVIGPTTLGILIAHETAKHLGISSMFAESLGFERVLRRGLQLHPGQRVLIVDDILTTGGSIKGILKLVHSTQSIPVGVGVLVNRSEDTLDFKVRLESLLNTPIKSWNSTDCPLCKQGIPVIKPGNSKEPLGV